MKKRILALFLCLVMALALVACGGNGETPSTDSNVGSVSGNSDAGSSEGGNDSSDKEETKVVGFDKTMEHKFITTDILAHSIVVYDLNKCNGDFQKLTDDTAVVWEWIPEEDPNLKTGGPSTGIDSAKYRYSSLYEKDVVIACSSNGWVGIIDYEAKSLVWEVMVHNGPHSVELLPNGDLVVASSYDPGELMYFALSADITDAPVCSIPFLFCHGVSWDPENKCLWVLENYGVYQVNILNMGTENAKLIRISGNQALFDKGEGGGHAFAPVAGDPGKYWASSGSQLWLYDSEEGTMSNTYPRRDILTKGNIKGICSFADGTVIQTVVGIGGNNQIEFGCDGFRIITREVTSGKVQTLKDVETIVAFSGREFYKVQAFTKDYQ